MFRKLLFGVAAVGALAFAAPSQAAPTTGLYLVMDGSGSIDATQFTGQITSYVNALNTFFTNNMAAFGQVAIGGNIFGADVSEFFPTTDIADATALASLTSAISGLDPGRGGINTGATAIGDAVTAATAALLAFDPNIDLIIDVTTDGANNTGLNPVTAASNAIGAGINAVNCLGIGAAADCSFVTGFGTDFGTVNFANLEAALVAKIQTETTGVPEPASLILLATSLIGAGLAARRRRSA